jgi:ribulose-5-phosphate 4-epimerase/fuculose-1-phosphate aldolase
MSLSIQTGTKETRMRESMVEVGRSLFDRGLTAGSSGNISVRIEEGWLLTPTNSSLGRLDPERLSKLDWNGNLISGDPPSKEAFLHRAMYDVRAGADAIIHLHSTHSAAVSCMDGLDHSNCIPPLTAYYVMKIGKLPLIPYHRPGDRSLEKTIRDLAKRHCAVLLANHGPVVSGSSLDAASFAMEELEETSKLFLLLRNSPVRSLDEAQIEDLKSNFNLEF